MAPSIKQNFERIDKSSEKFEEGANKVARLLQDVDRHLKDSAPHVESDEFTISETAKCYYTLYFGRDDDEKWALCVRKHVARQMEDSEGRNHVLKDDLGDPQFDTEWSRQLVSTPRDLRISAVARLNDVVENLADKVENSIASMEVDHSKIEEIAASIKSTSATEHDGHWIARYKTSTGTMKWLARVGKKFELVSSEADAATFSTREAASKAFYANGRDVGRNPDGVEFVQIFNLADRCKRVSDEFAAIGIDLAVGVWDNGKLVKVVCGQGVTASVGGMHVLGLADFPATVPLDIIGSAGGKKHRTTL